MHRPCTINPIWGLKHYTIQVMVMLDFICMGSAELWGMGNSEISKWKYIVLGIHVCFCRESNKWPVAFQPDHLHCLATGTDILLCLKLMQKNQHAAIWSIKLIMVRSVLVLSVRQSLHSFYKINVDVIYYCLQNFAWIHKTISIW